MKKRDDLTILHIDMDAFYASVEEQDRPQLKGRPVIVGGRSQRGIVTTCNYEARKFGVHSAMPIFMAKSLCPQAVYLPGRMDRYREVSGQVFKILYSFTDFLEPVSVDEAFMDISNLDQNPLDLVKDIKAAVKRELGLTMSVGISYNKFLAKLASDWNKPDGLKIISRDMIPDILLPLPVKKVYGIGNVSAKKLNGIGIYTIEDLYRLDKDFLTEFLGKLGGEVYQRIRGIDPRPVETDRERKSIGTERTFRATDDREILSRYLKDFSQELAENLLKKKIQARTISIKIKYDDFVLRTRSRTLDNPTYKEEEIYRWAMQLFSEVKLDRKLRLIGLSLSNLSDLDYQQLDLFDRI